MQVKYGTYAFNANGVKVANRQATLINAGGQPYAVERTLTLDGYLEGDGQSALVLAATGLMAALAVPYQDLVLFKDDGSPSDTSLYNAPSTTGVVPQAPSFPDSIGGEYATFRHFQLSAKAEYPLPNTGAILMSFTERLLFSGGGPIYAHRLSINGPPQKQLIYPQSVFKVTQEGDAVGYTFRPAPPPPIWPNDLVISPDASMDAPHRRGKKYTDFHVTWRYNFESATQLVGVPNIWKG